MQSSQIFRDKEENYSRRDMDEENYRDRDYAKKLNAEDSKLSKQEGNSGTSGGVYYIPPFKLKEIHEDKSSVEYQRLTWDALKKSINGLVNKVSATNIKNIIPELFGENLIRGRGLFCRSCIKSQMASPGFTDVFAALVAVVNTKFPVQVVHELIALELLAVLLENPSDDSVKIAVDFVTECGSMLQNLTPADSMLSLSGSGYPAKRPELDLVQKEDQFTCEISLQDTIDPEIALDIFKPDPNFLENEKKYEELKTAILGEESGESGDDDEEEQMKIKDETETNLVNLRRTIYLTIMSSVDFEETGHKLLKIELEPGQEMELCVMLLECCSQERTYLRKYCLLGQRLCMINKVYQENFERCFVQQYWMIHRLETNKLRNVAHFFGYLLGTDALSWHVLAYIRLTEEDTTSSSRIFIKILFQELSEHLGIRLLNHRLSDPTMQESFDSIFPKDNPNNTRFAINFFTQIGLGGITENLREYLKNIIMQQHKSSSSSEEDTPRKRRRH
nr:pre-mRNA-splicing factor CWC22 homolog [Ipomoea batatas]